MCDVVQVIRAHAELLQEITRNLKKGGRLVLVYQHHQMKLFERVENFVQSLENSQNFKRILATSVKMQPQFPEDNDFEGHVEIRSQIHLCVFERVQTK